MMVGTTMTSMIATELTRSVALPSPIGPFGLSTAQSQPLSNMAMANDAKRKSSR